MGAGKRSAHKLKLVVVPVTDVSVVSATVVVIVPITEALVVPVIVAVVVVSVVTVAVAVVPVIVIPGTLASRALYFFPLNCCLLFRLAKFGIEQGHTVHSRR
jgi:hypothetical protein